MKQFKDFGIKTVAKNFIGDKLPIRKILNRKIVVHDFTIRPSKFGSESDKCLYIQISVNDKKHIVFTGSTYLMEDILKIGKEDMPFETTITEEDDMRFQFN